MCEGGLYSYKGHNHADYMQVQTISVKLRIAQE